MLIIGERINTCRQSVMRAYAARDVILIVIVIVIVILSGAVDYDYD